MINTCTKFHHTNALTFAYIPISIAFSMQENTQTISDKIGGPITIKGIYAPLPPIQCCNATNKCDFRFPDNSVLLA